VRSLKAVEANVFGVMNGVEASGMAMPVTSPTPTVERVALGRQIKDKFSGLPIGWFRLGSG